MTPTCYCGSAMHLVTSGTYGPFYTCVTYPACDGVVGAHRRTLEPMGTPANAETRRLRMLAHEAFDKLWKPGGVFSTRTNAYQWLRNALGLRPSQCHIGLFDIGMCKRVVQLSEDRARW